ncbi:uncharacterized protein N7477_007853 [Penicillium maclennaniae]|uniref:uncharacterized protein n=1 Tax=Penicillium maclennaniae TaxID=1343394 RepID=UPI002540F86A|nr:uncharacterized protein N7477_007853 [Penicillium maclennaniae]KAJ5665405.1 hypothetical protein N7477_007853 [Penicillium maclennaniae]
MELSFLYSRSDKARSRLKSRVGGSWPHASRTSLNYVVMPGEHSKASVNINESFGYRNDERTNFTLFVQGQNKEAGFRSGWQNFYANFDTPVKFCSAGLNAGAR